MDRCTVCGADGVTRLTTYKSFWYECARCAGASRQQRLKYPLQWLADLLAPLAGSACARFALSIIGRKAQGVDVYRAYTQQIDSFIDTGHRDPCWAHQYERLAGQLRGAGIELGGRILDISGEPRFFAFDAKANGAEPTVTAFADEVAEAMKKLGVDSLHFDFNTHSIRGTGPFDAILSRYNLGFCENVPHFMEEAHGELRSGGVLVIQHSPYTRAIPIRWMFDDYTYLRCFSTGWLKDEAAKRGFRFAARFDEGKYRYNLGAGVWWPARMAATLYRALHPRLIASRRDAYQENETLVFQKQS